VALRRALLYTAANRAGAHFVVRASGIADTTDESDKAHSMSGFKEPGFTDRQKAAQQAKRDLLNKFRAQPGPDDPEVAKRRAEREAVAAARARAKADREAAEAEQKRLEAEAAIAEAARIAREKEEEAARLEAMEADQKAKRDARYAARKNRGKKK
jgi:membrane protein involved in colicin uptake